jgi:multicomponent K+:H+ antiporter subunit A
VLLFDLGVFVLVVGAAVLILVALAHQSRRGHRRPGAAHFEVEGKILQAGQIGATGTGAGVAPSTVTAQVPQPESPGPDGIAPALARLHKEV